MKGCFAAFLIFLGNDSSKVIGRYEQVLWLSILRDTKLTDVLIIECTKDCTILFPSMVEQAVPFSFTYLLINF